MNEQELRRIATRMASEIVVKFPSIKFDENYLIANIYYAILNSEILAQTGA